MRRHLGIRLYSLLFIALLLVASSFSSLLQSGVVSAAGLNLSVEDQTKSITEYNVLRVCVNNHMYGDINTNASNNTDATPTSVSWFDTNKTFVVYGSPNGKTCNQIMADALSTWGFKTDGSDFLTKMGYTFQPTGNSEGPRYHGSPDGSTRLSAYESLVQSVAFSQNFKGDAGLAGVYKYTAYKSSLPICEAKSLGSYSSLNSTQKSWVNSGYADGNTTYTSVVFANSDGTTSKYGYSYNNSVNGMFVYGAANDDVKVNGQITGVLSTSCSDALKQITATAPLAAAFAVITKVCQVTYTDISLINACSNGANNRAGGSYSLNYCANTYSGTATSATQARIACYKGQGNEGAEQCRQTHSANFSACMAGVQNSDSQYCQITYPLDSPTGVPSTNPANQAACLYGQGLHIAPSITGVDCNYNPAGAGCTAPTNNNASSCAIEGVGWIVCPVVSFLAQIADNAYGFLADNFLQVNSDIVATSGNNTGTYQAWQTMRTFANVLFVIAFLFIIFSQLTGQGVSNYGIKKMLPRLVITAILVNLSFFICQIAIDVSNILGYSLKQVFVSAGAQIPNPTPVSADDSNNWIGITATVLGGTAVAWALGISVLAPFLLGAVIALVLIFLILVVRQMLIILLVTLAPVAFVAYLLPNTEQWFTKWRKTLTTLLILFPLIGLLFGASGLASAILTNVYGGTGNWIAKIVARAVLVLPLFLLPALLKGSLNAVGNIGGRITSIGDRVNKGSRNKLSNTGLMKNYAAQKAQRRATIATGTYAGINPVSRLRSRTNRALNKNSLFNRVTSGYGADRTILGQGQQRKDAQEAMAMFGGDDKLVEAWGASAGDLNVANTMFKLTDAQKEQFKLLQNAGHSRKATSFLAAAQYLSENGKGSGTVVQQALQTAKATGASDIQIAGAQAAAMVAYRKSGRGDALAELSTLTGTKMSMEEGWKQVAPSAVHREGIQVGSPGLLAYQNHLDSTYEHTRQALMGFDSMEQRAKDIAENHIVAAAKKHETAATGAASTITNIRQAKDYFGVK